MRTAGHIFLCLVCLTGLAGCRSSTPSTYLASTQPSPPLETLTDSAHNPDVRAWVAVPVAWRPEPLKATPKHKHQVWLSPTGDTAYGVIRFELPLPLPVELVIVGFISEMRRDQGEAKLLYSQSDKSLPGLRFACEGGRYRLRGNMTVKGAGGWVVYAGTLRAREENPAELATAELAREQTRLGDTLPLRESLPR